MNILLSLFLLSLFTSSPARARDCDLTLVYNGSVHAELQDCGCKSRPLGGLARRAALLHEIRGENLLLVDAGNLLGDPTQDTLARSRFVAAETAAMGYEATAVGPYEFGHGIATVQDIALESGLDFLCANLSVDGARPFPASKVVIRDGTRVGLISVVDPAFDRAPYNGIPGDLQIEDPAAALAREIPLLRESCDVVVLLSNMEGISGTAALLRALPADLRIDIAVEGSASRHSAEPRAIGDTLVFSANGRGKYLGQADLVLRDGEVVESRGMLHDLVLDLPEDEALAGRITAFEETMELAGIDR